MNYYERHLGDYAKDTGHLSMLEHGAYTLLLDRYYSTECGIPAEQAYRIARARTKEERSAVDAVLREFFELSDGAWVKHRCQEEIEKAHRRVKAAQENGKTGGRPKRNPDPNPEVTQKKPNGFSLGYETETQTITQQKALQSPVLEKIPSSDLKTNPQTGAKPPDGDPLKAYIDRGLLVLKPALEDKKARSVLGKWRSEHGLEAATEAIDLAMQERPIDPVEYVQGVFRQKLKKIKSHEQLFGGAI